MGKDSGIKGMWESGTSAISDAMSGVGGLIGNIDTMAWVVLGVGGLVLVLLIGGVAWGVGSGNQQVDKIVTAAAPIAETAIKAQSPMGMMQM